MKLQSKVYTLHFYLTLPKNTEIAKTETDLTLKLIIRTRISACKGAKDPLHPPTLIRVCLFLNRGKYWILNWF